MPPEEIDEFEIIVGHPSEFGKRYGVRIMYLQEHGRFGRLRATKNRAKDTWRFVPDNVMAFEIDEEFGEHPIEVDATDMDITEAKSVGGLRQVWIRKSHVAKSVSTPR